MKNSRPMDFRRLRRLITFSAAGLTIAALAGIGFDLRKSFQAELSEATETNKRLVATSAGGLSRTFENAEFVLRSAAHLIGTSTDPEAEPFALLDRYFSDLKEKSELTGVLAVDANGTPVYSSEPWDVSKANFADREYFREAKSEARERLFIGLPVQARLSGRYVVPVAMPLIDGQGKFSGALIGGLEMSSLHNVLNSVAAGEGGGAAVIRSDARLLARAPERPGLPGTDLSRAPLFREYLPHAPRGTFIAETAIDRVERLISYETLEAFPLIAVVGTSTEQIFRSWWAQTSTYLSFGLLFTLAIGGAAALLVRQLRELEAVQTEQQLQHSRFDDFASMSADWFCEVDTQGRYRFALGRDDMFDPNGSLSVAFVGRSQADAVAAFGGSPATAKMLEHHKTSGRPFRNVEVELDHPKYGALHLSFSGIPIFDETGAHHGCRATARNITEQKLIQKSLEESEERFRLIAEGAPLGIARVGAANGIIHFANAAMAVMVGVDREELEGRSINEFFLGPFDRPEAMTPLLRERGAPAVEAQMKRSDGSTIWSLLSLSPARGGGEEEEILIAGIDITRLKHTERQLAERTRDLGERVKEQSCLYAVARLLNDTRAPVEQLMAALVDLLPSGWRRPELACARVKLFGATYQTANFRPTEWSMVRTISLRDREIGDVEVGYVKQPPLDDQELFLDEEYRLLEAIALHIHQWVVQHETFLQLQQSQKLEVVGQLAGGIAHDFNNLLTVSLLNVELARQQVRDNPDLEKSLELIEQATTRGADLTQRLLAFSRRQELTPTTIDLNALVRPLLALVERTIGPSIRFETDLAEDLPPARIDPVQLESAILNLAVNARDAMPKGGTLMLKTARRRVDEDDAGPAGELAPGDYLCIEVGDTGTGMTADVAERVFEPFYTTKEVGKGTGLGLSMVYGFIKQSRGDVRVSTTPGRGSTFSLFIPVDRSGAPATVLEAKPDTRTVSGGTILVVEDTQAVAGTICDTLRREGFHILSADRAASALDILDSPQQVDLLLTDIGLPGGMNGAALAKAAEAVRPQVKVLFMSGHPYQVLPANESLPIGARLVQKPCRRGDLLTAVEEALRQPPTALGLVEKRAIGL